MGFRSYVKNTVKDNSNIKGWASWDTIKENGKVIAGFVKNMKPSVGDTASIPMTFEETVATLRLSESDLQKRMKKHFWVSIGCVFFGLIGLGWMIMLLMKMMLLSSLVALSLSALMLAYAFQENFRCYQIKQRRLNCTINEWVSSFFSSKK